MCPYHECLFSTSHIADEGSNKGTPRSASDEEDPGASALKALLEFQKKIEDEKQQKVQTNGNMF